MTTALRHGGLAAAVLAIGWSAGPTAGQLSGDDGAATRYRATELFPLREQSLTYRFIEGDLEGDTAEAKMERTDRGDNVWSHTIDGLRTEYLTESEAGDIVLLSEELPSEGYVFRYDPPLMIVPATVTPGASYRQSGEVHVYDIDDGNRRNTSRYEHRIRVKGLRSVPADGGRMNAIVIATQREADLGEAEVETEIETAYYPSVGRVYQRFDTSAQGGPFNLWSQSTVHTLRYSSNNR